MTDTKTLTGRRSPLLERGASHGGGRQTQQEAARASDGKASTRWHELVSELAKPTHSQTNPSSPAQTQSGPDMPTVTNQNSPPRSADLDGQAVRDTLERAVQAAKADTQWSASGLPESLQRTVQLCSSEGPTAAKTAALGLLDFHQIVKNTKLRSPKTPSPPLSPERHDGHNSSWAGRDATGAQAANQHPADADGNSRLVTSGNQGSSHHNRHDVIGQSSPTQADQPARAIFRERSRGGSEQQPPQQPDSKDESQNAAAAQPPRQGKEYVSPIALQVATLMRDHLRSIQASGVLPPVSLELPAVPQLQLNSAMVIPHTSSAGFQPATTGQQIAVINSCPLLVIPSALTLPPEPSLYRPVRPNRTISAPSEGPQRPTQPIRCISAPSRLPTEPQPIRPGNVISSGVPQAHPRYREASRLTPSAASKPTLAAANGPPEVKVRVVHAPTRGVQDSKPEPELMKVLSGPTSSSAISSDTQVSAPAPQSRSPVPRHAGSAANWSLCSDVSETTQHDEVKAERSQRLSTRPSASPFAQGESSRAMESGRARERSPTPEEEQSPKRRKLTMQKALSLNTVLRCVDKHNGQDEGLDAHVGEAPTRIEDMADADGEQPDHAHSPLLAIRSAPAQTSASQAPEQIVRASRSSPSPPLLHQMVRQVCEAVGETWRNSLQQHIQSSLNALGPAPQPLNAGPSLGSSAPLSQAPSVGPSGLPSGTLSIYQGSAMSSEPPPLQHAASSPGSMMGEGALSQDAAAAAVGRGFHLGDMPPCTSMTASKTALWSGKVKHKHGDSVVELFHMTALIPEQFLERLPPTLFASELANRSNVKLRQQVFVMRCKLGFLSDRQLHKLHMLAHLKLVAICHLQHVTITLVPYYNSQNGFKVVGFMLADD